MPVSNSVGRRRTADASVLSTIGGAPHACAVAVWVNRVRVMP